MWKKTPLRSLEAYVPTSSEWLLTRAQAAATAGRPVQVAGFTAPPHVPAGNGHTPEPVVDAEIVEDPAAGDETQAPPPPQDRPQRPTKQAAAHLDTLLRQLPLGPPEDQQALIEWVLGGPYRGTRAHCQNLTAFLERQLQDAEGNTDLAAEAIWERYRAATQQDAAEGTQDPPEGGDG